jgi:AcrR family transcriptional regulator
MRLLRKRAFERVSIAEVARAAGVGIGTLYRYYPSKEALLLDLRRRDLEDIREQLTEAFASPIAGRREMLARLERLLRLWVQHSVEHRTLERAAIAASLRSEAFAGRIREDEERVRLAGEALIAAHADELRPLDPRAAAHVIYMLLEATVVRATRFADVAARPDELIREAVRMVGFYLVPDERRTKRRRGRGG